MSGVSMVITTRNRTKLLDKSMQQLARLTLPDQIVVVDDGGTDDCHDVCTRLGVAGLPIEYHYYDNPGETNCCRARNHGLRLTKHDRIIVSEPELLFITDVVKQMTSAARAYPSAVLHEANCYHEPHANAGVGECTVVPGFYVHHFAKRWLLEVGGWDEAMPGPWGWDDIDLYNRLEQTGHRRQGLTGIAVQHQWHPSRIEPAVENERYVRAKVFPNDVVANQRNGS